MIKLLIVDDEPIVQVGMKSMLNWSELGIEVCGTAMNGQVALNMIRELQPEIVITDIKMPLMNGLELARASRDEFGKIPLFIVLTSYEEFHLVKEAISIQVVDYLIKLELSPEELKTSIQKALNMLEDIKSSMPQNPKNAIPVLQSYQDKFFLKLLYNLFDSEQQFNIQAKDLQLDFYHQVFLATHGELHASPPAGTSRQQSENLYSSSLQMVQEIMAKHTPCHIVSLDRKHFSIIIHYREQEEQPDIHAALEGLSMINNYFNVKLTIGVGSPVDHPLKISQSYQEARQAFSLASPAEPIVYYHKELVASSHNAFNMSVFKEALSHGFEEFNAELLADTFTEIIQLFSSHPSRYLQAIDAASNILYLTLSLLPDGEESVSGIFKDYSDGYRSLYRLNSTEQIAAWLEHLRDGLTQVIRAKKRTYKDRVIINVQKYILNHIEEKLTLNEVSDLFGLSPNYLSALFKRSCNVGFSEYITQNKVAKAKHLLLEQNRKIYEVADDLGFESAFYFSKVFKKVEGISPREFVQQKMMGSDKET